ncbi:uncharacterized protein BCR38DRAFT_517760, partial [Pseudomassariella vexata]
FLDPKKNANRIFPGGIELKYSSISSRSIEALSKCIRFARGGHICRPNPTSESRSAGPVRYSCVYWVDHLDDGDSSVNPKSGEVFQDSSAIQKFLEQSYTHWLESLGLLGDIPKGVSSKSKLPRLLEGKESVVGLAEVVYDALRFIQSHSVVITGNPLQVYVSA